MNTFNCSPHRLTAIVIALFVFAPYTALATGDSTNTAYGNNTLSSNTGYFNSAFGNAALHSNLTGNYNTAFGASSLYFNTAGSLNTAVGNEALYSNREGDYNTAIGSDALFSNTSGWSNTAIGVSALLSNTTGNSNTASGNMALLYNTYGSSNTATGVSALYFNTNGDNNTAIGAGALYSNDSGWGNTGSGYQALSNNVSGHNNLAVGFKAGYEIRGSNNIMIGHAGDAGDNNTTRIGDGQNRTFVAGISGIRASGGVQVYVNSAGQLGTTTSSERFKKEIRSIDSVSDKLLQLRPVSFIYKEDETKELQYGLIAEEVAKVYPELVQYDAEGKPFTVYYHLLTPLLLSEVQKAHALNDAQQSTMTAQLEKLQAQQIERTKLTQQLAAQRAEMAVLLQQEQEQQQQQMAEISAIREKINQLGDLVEAKSSPLSSEKVALAVSH